LASELEAHGAQVFVANNAYTGLSSLKHPDLAAAVLDSKSHVLYPALRARNVPFLIYTGKEQVGDECADAVVMRKPANADEVIAAVECLLLPNAVTFQTSPIPSQGSTSKGSQQRWHY